LATSEQVRTGSVQAATKGRIGRIVPIRRSGIVTSAVSAPFLKSPRILEAAIAVCGLLSGFLTPLILNCIDSVYYPRGFCDGNGIVLAIGGAPFALLIAVIARIAADVSWLRAAALGVATMAATSASITLSANTNAALGSIGGPARELIGGPVGGVIGSGLMALAAMLLRIGPRHPARWWAFVLVGTVLGALLAVDVWLDSENVWVIFPVWQASIALIFFRTLQSARATTGEA
jgi:hypothetical protein